MSEIVRPDSEHLAPENPDAPGLPAHRLRRTDVDPIATKRAERQVANLFLVAIIATVGFVVAFVAFPSPHKYITIIPGVLQDISASNFFLGMTLAISLLAIGVGAIHWAKKLMSDVEIVELRHPSASSAQDRAEFQEVFETGVASSGIKEYKLIRRTLIGAMLVLPIPALLLFRDLGPLPRKKLSTTAIHKGVRLVVDGTQAPLRPSDIPIGALVNVVPENLQAIEEAAGTLDERGKDALMIIRMRPDQIIAQQGANWDVEGILCFSKVCTHAGCPLGLYEQQTHHMLCPCHQSTFDLSDAGRVIFGPAARSLPQLAITTNADGYLVAAQGFTQPVGPSFWERS
ncbi:MAG TPA: Rieske 2Fe-2S domain-containing protein [Actinomycetes bacterium]|nr:Rieske 2Fe-2S domain-containing protein [Actinomycetes bacterium]